MLPGFLRPAFPDAGRFVVQGPALRALATAPLTGAVLNAGCGEGLYCPWIESFPGVTSIENLDTDLPVDWFAAMYPDPRHRARIGSLTSLPYADQTFDVVVCTEVIEHIQDDAMAVAELARVTRPGGVLFASVPLRPAPFDPNHARADYSLEEFRTLLGRAAFTIEAHRVCCHAVLRSVMHYWRRPLLRVPGNRVPYVPRFAMTTLAHLDRWVRLGKPWDLVVRARRM